jgi:hypothetical protein
VCGRAGAGLGTALAKTGCFEQNADITCNQSARRIDIRRAISLSNLRTNDCEE